MFTLVNMEAGAVEAAEEGELGVRGATTELGEAGAATEEMQGRLQGADPKVTEQIKQEIENINNAATTKVINGIPSGEGITQTNVEEFGEAANKLLDDAGGEESKVMGKAEAKADGLSESTKQIEKPLRSIFQYMSDGFDKLVKSMKGDKVAGELDALGDKLTESVKTKDPTKIKEAIGELDNYVSENLRDVDDKIKEETEGKSSVDNFTRIKPYLKVLGLAAILSLLTIFFMKDTGCWKFSDGVKSVKINDFDFKNNTQYCSCSDSDNFSTPQPLSSWCPPGVTKGSPTYVTCPPYNYPACTIKDNSSGIYYGYYVSSPMGVLNTTLNQAGRVFRGVTSGFSNMIANIILIITVLLVLFLVAKGATAEENGNTYYVIAGAVGAIGGYVYYIYKS